MALSLVTFVAGTKAKASEVNSNFSALNVELFDIDENNFNVGAQLPDSLLATISTSNKVNGGALVAQTIDAVKGQFVWGLAGTLGTGTNVSFEFEASATLTMYGVKLRAKTGPTGAALIVDINKNGTTVFSTRPQINDGSTTGGGSAVFSVTTLAAGDYLTVDIDQVGSTVAGADLTVMLQCKQKVPQT